MPHFLVLFSPRTFWLMNSVHPFAHSDLSACGEGLEMGNALGRCWVERNRTPLGFDSNERVFLIANSLPPELRWSFRSMNSWKWAGKLLANLTLVTSLNSNCRFCICCKPWAEMNGRSLGRSDLVVPSLFRGWCAVLLLGESPVFCALPIPSPMFLSCCWREELRDRHSGASWEKHCRPVHCPVFMARCMLLCGAQQYPQALTSPHKGIFLNHSPTKGPLCFQPFMTPACGCIGFSW